MSQRFLVAKVKGSHGAFEADPFKSDHQFGQTVVWHHLRVSLGPQNWPAPHDHCFLDSTWHFGHGGKAVVGEYFACPLTPQQETEPEQKDTMSKQLSHPLMNGARSPSATGIQPNAIHERWSVNGSARAMLAKPKNVQVGAAASPYSLSWT